jgi:pantetheine-phosphate adenylyltransferase
MKIAVFPGSFDPITKGHESIVNRASDLFDKIYVAIGVNANKKYTFDLEKRVEFIHSTFANNSKVEVITYQNLTVSLCEELGASYIIRGLRNSSDFDYEFPIAEANRQMNKRVETLFLATEASLMAINSSIVRDIYRHGGDIKAYIPDAVKL